MRSPSRGAAALTTLLALGLSFGAAGCEDSVPPLVTVRPPPDAGCQIESGPQRYEVYLVIDVSGSMTPFLEALGQQIQSFADAFPARDASGSRVLVDYYVIAFVNDVLWFPNNARRMTNPIAVQSAIRSAIEQASNNTLLTSSNKNAESDENLLDALAQAIDHEHIEGASILTLVATDASFRESGERLSGGVTVQTDYADVLASLEMLGAQVHAFTPDNLDGLTRQFEGQPSLTTLPGSGSYSLRDLEASGELIERTLQDIAQSAACN